MTAAIQFAFRLLSLRWLTGPIFDKELRVISRRRRSYALRSAYVGALAVFAIVTWIGAVEWGDDSARTVYSMSRAGKIIITVIMWFQFLAIQLVAVILMSTSISDEVHHGTLAALMTTPITVVQIVAGKMLSKLLHLLSLVLISLPLLAVLRVFGGVPWGSVVAGGCITLTAAALAGAVAMFFSTLFRRAYASILLTLAAGFVFHFVLPMILSMILMVMAMGAWNMDFMVVLVYVNPFYAMSACTAEMLQPGATAPLTFYWPLHCLVMLGVTFVILLICVRLVRRVSLRKAFGRTYPGRLTGPPAPSAARAQGQAQRPPPPGPPGRARAVGPAISPAQLAVRPPPPPPSVVVARPAGKIRRITGSPLVWKKLRTPMIPGKVLRIVALVLAIVLVGATYLLLGLLGGLEYARAQAVYVDVFVVLAMTATAVFAATCISSEKESRTLPILLTTPLDDWHVVGAAVLEVVRRSLPVWGMLIGHLAIFTIVGFLRPMACLLLGMLMIWTMAFLTGAGLYFSARFGRTTPAVVLNLGLALTLWVILPVVIGAMGRPAGFSEDVAQFVQGANPAVQADLLAYGAGTREFALFFSTGAKSHSYDWPSGVAGPGRTAWLMLLYLLGYGLIACLFLWRAKVQLRRSLF